MAQPRVQRFTVSTGQALEEAMVTYLAKGFVVANKTAVSFDDAEKEGIQGGLGHRRISALPASAAGLPHHLCHSARCRDRGNRGRPDGSCTSAFLIAPSYWPDFGSPGWSIASDWEAILRASHWCARSGG